MSIIVPGGMLQQRWRTHSSTDTSFGTGLECIPGDGRMVLHKCKIDSGGYSDRSSLFAVCRGKVDTANRSRQDFALCLFSDAQSPVHFIKVASHGIFRTLRYRWDSNPSSPHSPHVISSTTSPHSYLYLYSVFFPHIILNQV